MSLITPLCLWAFSLLFTRITCLQPCKPFQVKPEHLNKQLLGYKLFDKTVMSHHECAQECMFMGACVSINFITSTKTCEFNSESSETVGTSAFNKTKGIIFSDISEWPKAIVGGCENHQCDKAQGCLPIDFDSYKCKNITCKNPQNSDQRVEEDASVIAATVRSYVFACPDNMFLSGDKDVTCNVNGEWTESKATCQELTIGKGCSVNSDCKETGGLCKGGRCYCSRFYRYDANSRDCIKVCSAMNSTFAISDRVYIVNRNDLGEGTVASIEKCYSLCSEDEECMSFEYRRDTRLCRRSSFTKQMVEAAIPEDVVYDAINDIVLYEKKCF